MKKKLLLFIATLFFFLSPQNIQATDWSTYRGNAARTGFTSEQTPGRFHLRWVFKSQHPPKPAWIMSRRLGFDKVFQPIIMGDTIYWGSSVDDQVYAVDMKTGKLRWTFFTEGPIRFAPAGWKDRLFVVSDDGWLYAISAKSGKLLWKHRGGPNNRKIMGNERLISRWPARGGAVVVDETVYFAAGIWQSDGVFIYALDTKTGKVKWSNKKSGGLEMDQPHGRAKAKSGVSAQGYLLADHNQLYIPTGRAVPAVFQRNNGKLLYYHLQKNQRRGGSRAMLADQFLHNGGVLFDKKTGGLASRVGLGAAVALPSGIVQSEGKSLAQYRWKDQKTRDRKGKLVKRRVLEKRRLINCEKEVLEFIIAGNYAIRGEDGRVSMVDYASQQNTIWSHKVKGRALGLAFGNGRLIVSTDKGYIYCFDGHPELKTLKEIQLIQQPVTKRFTQAADEIIKKTGTTDGYCVDLECETGDLAMALAAKTKLHIYAMSSSKEKVTIARKKINAAGLYGSRITVHLANPAESIYPKYFANLVVSEQSLSGDIKKELRLEMKRIQRPYGGIICTGSIGNMKAQRRGDLKGAGSWTHMYSDAANTVCSSDDLLKGPLEMGWFRDVDFELLNRHGRGPAPLMHRGVMVVGGVHGICALDAYNGRTLWIYNQKEYLRAFDGSHHDVASTEVGNPFCIGDKSLFLRTENRCIQLDLKTGKKIAEFLTPTKESDKNRAWGYLAYQNGLLFGSVSNEEHRVSPRYKRSQLFNESVKFFVIDVKTKKMKWEYSAKNSIRNNTIAIGTNNVYLIDRKIAMKDRIANPRRNGRPRPQMKPNEQPSGLLISFNAKTGKIDWKKNKEIFGTQLSVSNKLNVLLMSYLGQNHNFFSLPSEVGGRLAALDSKTGERLWDKKANYRIRPIINGSTIYTQNNSWYLKSGEALPFKLNRSYGCGQVSASKHMMLFRSATLGYLDLTRDAGVENYGGIRLGCWINAIPAGGLVLVPDGSAKCRCSYQMKAWFALQPKSQRNE